MAASKETKTQPPPLRMAVLFLVFNRLDTTKQVFEEIRLAKPPRLYIAADGARAAREGEAQKVQAVRDYVLSHIDWECEVKTLFREQNLGCKYAVSGGISWFFEHEEMGIILEDDCLPDPTFFLFCQEMLERYQNDERVGMIGGVNNQVGRKRNNDSYYFTKYSHIWGWASWRDRWLGSYDVSMSEWPRIKDGGWLVDMVGGMREAKYWTNIFDLVYHEKIDTWDYQWVFANFLNSRKNILPNINMISNIGFNQDATHTTDDSIFSNMQNKYMAFPLVHPFGVFVNMQADEYTRKISYSRLSLLRRVVNKMKRLIK